MYVASLYIDECDLDRSKYVHTRTYIHVVPYAKGEGADNKSMHVAHMYILLASGLHWA